MALYEGTRTEKVEQMEHSRQALNKCKGTELLGRLATTAETTKYHNKPSRESCSFPNDTNSKETTKSSSKQPI
jgi:hypothetical protein